MLTAPIRSMVIALALLITVTAAWSATMNYTLGGYLQARYTDDLGNGGVSTFLDTRPSILIKAIDEKQKIFGQIFAQAASGTTFELQHAFAEYRAEPNFVRLGLLPVPFGYENPVSSSRLITTERSRVSSGLFAVSAASATPTIPTGTYALDRGVNYYYTKLDGATKLIEGPNVSVALVNGMPYSASRDVNDTKNVVARVGYRNDKLDSKVIPVKVIDAGVSIYDGKNGDGGTMDRQGLDVQAVMPVASGQLTLLGEAMNGKGRPVGTSEVESNGFYLTAAYRLKDLEPYARYDAYDPDTATTDDYYKRTTLGTSYYFNPLSKIQGEYEIIDDELTPTLDGRVTVQYQIIF